MRPKGLRVHEHCTVTIRRLVPSCAARWVQDASHRICQLWRNGLRYPSPCSPRERICRRPSRPDHKRLDQWPSALAKGCDCLRRRRACNRADHLHEALCCIRHYIGPAAGEPTNIANWPTTNAPFPRTALIHKARSKYFKVAPKCVVGHKTKHVAWLGLDRLPEQHWHRRRCHESFDADVWVGMYCCLQMALSILDRAGRSDVRARLYFPPGRRARAHWCQGMRAAGGVAGRASMLWATRMHLRRAGRCLGRGPEDRPSRPCRSAQSGPSRCRRRPRAFR